MDDRVELYTAMSTTRAVRRLRPDPVPDDVLKRVLTAFTWGPSGGNRQPWRLVVVRDASVKTEMQRLYSQLWRPYAEQGRRSARQLPAQQLERVERNLNAGDHLAANLGQVPVLVVVCFDPRGLAVTDVGLERVSVVGGASIYAAVQNMLLACRAEGLGCVLTTLLCQVEPQIRALLDIPEPWSTAACVPIGYPLGGGHGPVRRQSIEVLTFENRWGSPLYP